MIIKMNEVKENKNWFIIEIKEKKEMNEDKYIKYFDFWNLNFEKLIWVIFS